MIMSKKLFPILTIVLGVFILSNIAVIFLGGGINVDLFMAMWVAYLFWIAFIIWSE
jgi:hypothetical protein